MTFEVHDQIALHALDLLDVGETAHLEAAIAADPDLAAELVSLREATHQLAAALPEVKPSPDLEARLMSSIGSGRFERYSEQVAQLFDVSLDRAREILGFIDRPAAWVQVLPNVGLIHFKGGPRCATADCGAVRVRAGGEFPLHSHRGDEMSVIVAGTVRLSDGTRYRAGDAVYGKAGTSHALTAEGDEDLILLARAFDGIEVARARQP